MVFLLVLTVVPQKWLHRYIWIHPMGTSQRMDPDSCPNDVGRGAGPRIMRGGLVQVDNSILSGEPTSAREWENHGFCAGRTSESQYFMAFGKVLNAHHANLLNYVNQKAFDGRICYRWLSCYCCL